MFETSQDILYIALSFCVLWFTIFLVWLMWQAGRLLKNINEIVENLTKKLELIADAVEFMRGKVDTATSHMSTVSKFLTGTIGSLITKKISKAFEEKLSDETSKKNTSKKRKRSKKS